MSVEEISKRLKQLVLDPAFKVFPPIVKTKYKKKVIMHVRMDMMLNVGKIEESTIKRSISIT